MAHVGNALRDYLLTKTSVTSIVGQRIYPDDLPQSASTPAIVYRVVSTSRDHSIGDCLNLAHSRVEMLCYGNPSASLSGRAVANSLSAAIRKCGITSYRGTTSGIFFNGVEIDSGDQFLDDPPNDGNAAHRYLVSFDFMVHYTEA